MEGLENFLLNFFQQQIFLGPILFLVIEEAGIPLPVENIIFTYIGYQVGKGHLPFVVGYLLLLLAIMIGSSFLYYISAKYGQNLILKLGKLIHVDQSKLLKVESWFNKYGVFVIIFGRHVPGFRVPITIFSGASKLSYPVFILCLLASDAFTIPFYMTLGMKFGPKAANLLQLHQGLYLVLILILIMVLGIYFLLFSRRKK